MVEFIDIARQKASELGYRLDDAQLDTVNKLNSLCHALDPKQPGKRFLSRLFKSNSYPRGMYIWGGVGRGKTFLMDLFFEHVPFDKKRRIHFHRFMQDVHRKLGILQGNENPLEIAGEQIAFASRLLCIDEFHVSDIGDAMIMRNLLDALIKQRVTIVTTANWAPDRLYEHGLQRAQFVPTIELIKSRLDVVNLDAGTDYRLASLEKSGVYFLGEEKKNIGAISTLFHSLSVEYKEQTSISINDRDIDCYRLAENVVWFDFNEICDGPRGKDDYIELSKEFPTVFISGIPTFRIQNDNARRRFTWLVDEFYDRRVKLILSSTSEISKIFSEALGGPEKERTESRLIEMQSRRYLGEPHKA